ncbi:MAG: sugar transferase [bacterium]|nr:MAG: sugar transferase [bacterium]
MKEIPGPFHRATTSISTYTGSVYRRAPEHEMDGISFLSRAVSYVPEWRIGQAILVKRAFDIVFGSIALVLLSPVLAIAAILIKMESRGPVMFVQERIGINRRRRAERREVAVSVPEERRKRRERRRNIHPGKPFKIYKLRTMRIDAEMDGPVLAQEDDPRITCIGRIMRKSRVDEIPQFINVIKGDMSIVGPRPERSFFINVVRKELPEFILRLMVKPGITGLAQVESGYTQTIDKMREKLFYDLRYIVNLSIIQEFKILLKTVTVVFTGKGAC